jgi:hypothetical protein
MEEAHELSTTLVFDISSDVQLLLIIAEIVASFRCEVSMFRPIELIGSVATAWPDAWNILSPKRLGLPRAAGFLSAAVKNA